MTLKNDYEIRGETTAIFVRRRNGDIFEFLIDTDDLPKLIEAGGSWCVDLPYKPKDEARKPYAIRNAPREDGGRQYVKLHRFLTDAPEGMVVDHIDGNTLDNRRNNLRITDQYVNQQNRNQPNRNSRSGIRGVHWNHEKRAWDASAMINGVSFRARFKNKVDAIDAASRMRRGEWVI